MKPLLGYTHGSAAPPELSGIYPHLAMFNDEGECGTGAVVPWADRLWIVTCAPHQPKGSSDKLYEIYPRSETNHPPESIGGSVIEVFTLVHPFKEQPMQALAARRMNTRHAGFPEQVDRLCPMIRNLVAEGGFEPPTKGL